MKKQSWAITTPPARIIPTQLLQNPRSAFHHRQSGFPLRPFSSRYSWSSDFSLQAATPGIATLIIAPQKRPPLPWHRNLRPATMPRRQVHRSSRPLLLFSTFPSQHPPRLACEFSLTTNFFSMQNFLLARRATFQLISNLR